MMNVFPLFAFGHPTFVGGGQCIKKVAKGDKWKKKTLLAENAFNAMQYDPCGLNA